MRIREICRISAAPTECVHQAISLIYDAADTLPTHLSLASATLHLLEALKFVMAFPVAATTALNHTIAPIKGGLKRRALVDITAGLGLGIAAGYAYWYGWRLPAVARREAYYAKLKAEKE
ncbi:hypothetical protein BJ684DRAFT_18500 [Piptocephalis cylindrospora]|uniref:Uncharacterized protein n=1 Tax=Piptocephalis cylindrospora TaxID=1907219 RepID=A0A4V1IYN2_9FUNG|nr:hypothetical protein BJ684DRAFT_18500 [Piptocephalis cylindrospora]|eukprot:RKP15149.1 hypothetical protein BJ684DRAFT_18500 [Piptocephalis cylindrospora]